MKTSTPEVAVVIPTYNRWPFVREAVESVLNQSNLPSQVIVVDDGSADGTLEKLRVQFGTSIEVITQENAERGVARNRGLCECSADYVVFLDADDVLEPWQLRQFKEAWPSAPSGAFFSAPAVLWNPLTRVRRPISSPPIAREESLYSALLGTFRPLPGLVIPRGLLTGFGGFPTERSIAGSEDYVLLARLTGAAPVVRLPEVGARIREHAGRSMNDDEARIASHRAAAELLLEEGLGSRRLSPAEAKLVRAGDCRFRAAHAYRIGQMQRSRRALHQMRAELGLSDWLSGAGLLWCQTWLGARGSRLARDARGRLVWR